ncbi:hypothetical protein LRR81_04560 [Metabacillus sp. GX 13764]|nr:hypothetical protein [Metabacillus kandeliae]MCD7033493.1 hypothetical protein [Metabacillus kandeliae]
MNQFLAFLDSGKFDKYLNRTACGLFLFAAVFLMPIILWQAVLFFF